MNLMVTTNQRPIIDAQKNKGDLNKSLKRVFNVQEKKARKATTTKTTRKE